MPNNSCDEIAEEKYSGVGCDSINISKNEYWLALNLI